MRYNPPPNWPPAPAGWTPPQGWQPDPSWGPPPPGWQLWIDGDPKKHTRRNVVLSVVGVVVILLVIGALVGSKSKAPAPAANGDATSSAPSSSPPAPSSAAAPTTTTAAPTTTKAPPPAVLGNNDEAKKDVKITACAKDDAGFMDAKVLITNHSSKPSNYIVNIVFESLDGKTQLGTGFAAADDLQPGQKAPQEANGLKESTGKFTCRVSSVTRYAAG